MNITSRKNSRKPFNPEVCKQYLDGATITEIAHQENVSISNARLRLIASGITLRTIKQAHKVSKFDRVPHGRKLGSAPKSDSTKSKLRQKALVRGELFAAGVSLKPNGYLEYTRGPHKGRSVHVIVMETQLGRRLQESECVHHKDRNKTNNSPSNLMLMTRSTHLSLHRKEGW